MKVTQNGMVWRALPQSTIVPRFMTVVAIVFEKMSMFVFGTDGRTDRRTIARQPMVQMDKFLVSPKEKESFFYVVELCFFFFPEKVEKKICKMFKVDLSTISGDFH